MRWPAILIIVAACGSSQPASREDIGIRPEAEGVCTHDGQTLVLSKWPGGLCGKNPAEPPAKPVPTCTELAAQMGCK